MSIGKASIAVMIVACLAAGLFACSSSLPSPAPSATINARAPLQPYWTVTSSNTAAPPVYLTPVPLTPAPTPTPFTHKVVKGETMLGIAIKYGIKLEDLLVANPTVNPRMMSVDTLLVIPLQNGGDQPAPTATALPLSLSIPDCYGSVEGGQWCVVSIENDLDAMVENISAWMGWSSGEETLTSQVVMPALNILPGGQRIPLLAYFPDPIPMGALPRAELLTALPVLENDPRYLPAQVELVKVTIMEEGRTAQVKARVSWVEGQPLPAQVWVVIVAYDAQDRAVGMRKLETRPICAQPADGSGCTSLDIDGTVYSLGPAIQRVEGLVEARP